MTFIELAKQRFSVRKYNDRKVEPEKVRAILEAARIAPTACNNQPFKLLVLDDGEQLARLRKAAETYSAPLVIVVCADRSECWTRSCDGKKSGDIDASIVADHIMLQATELELGSVWICNFNPATLADEFHLPANLEPVNLMAIGYHNNEEPNPRHFRRKSLDELIISL
jgi:nitroreductase